MKSRLNIKLAFLNAKCGIVCVQLLIIPHVTILRALKSLPSERKKIRNHIWKKKKKGLKEL